MKNLYTYTKMWTLGLAVCCLSILGAANSALAGGAPANDLCANAEPITCGDVLAGTNVGATEQAIPTGGGTVGQGVWYSFTGTGADITLTVCDDATFDTEINILTSTDCINFVNVAGNDDDTGCSSGTSEVTFTSIAGQEYYAYVSDWVTAGGNTGTFNLTMNCAPPVNDVCAGAISVACGDVITGNTAASTSSDAPSGPTSISDGLWYVITGTGDDITVSTCGTADFDTEISVSEGSCGSLSWVGGNDDASGCTGSTSEYTFSSVAGTDYYVYVGHWNSTAGDASGTFDLSITCTPPPPVPTNDLCANAEALACGDVVFGTTINAGSDGADDCHSGYEGVWYSFVGTGGDITLSTDNPGTDFDTYLAISETCGGPCVASNDDGGTGTTSIIENFATTLGQTYYVNVMQWSTSGDFELSLECAPIPCLNSSAWPTGPIPLLPDATTEIANDAYSADEYSEVSNVLTGHEYVFDITSGAYATVRMTTYDGPVVAAGFTPLTVTATSTDNLFVHWTVDETCATDASGTHTSTVTDLGLPQCNNDGNQWPSSPITPDPTGVTSISGCNYEGEYSIITGVEASYAYQFTSTGIGGYITVTVGAADGPVLGAGYTPLDVTTLSTDDLYVHWSEDEFCNTNTTCATTTVENLGLVCAVSEGTATANAAVVCLDNGTATIAVTPNGDAVVPAGYSLIGVLADGSGNLLDGGNITFDVNAVGDYYIHIAVVADADLASYQTESTVAGIHALTINGGGSLCGTIDQLGTLLSVIDCPDNDLCADAEPLTCGVTVTATTLGATESGSPSDCGALASDLGVWYTFTGTGGNVKLSTCGATTASSVSQPWFGVYSGPTCAQLTCVGFPVSPAGEDPDCGTTGSLSYEFTTTAGETYYVFVASVDGTPNTVDFDLTLTCDPTVGIAESASIDDLQVYPNPSNGEFVVELSGVDTDAQLTITDVTGRTVYTEGVSMNGNFRKALNLNVASGTYLLQITSEEGNVTRKIQVK